MTMQKSKRIKVDPNPNLFSKCQSLIHLMAILSIKLFTPFALPTCAIIIAKYSYLERKLFSKTTELFLSEYQNKNVKSCNSKLTGFEHTTFRTFHAFGQAKLTYGG